MSVAAPPLPAPPTRTVAPAKHFPPALPRLRATPEPEASGEAGTASAAEPSPPPLPSASAAACALPPSPVSPAPPRNILFALEDPKHLLSAIKCTFDHLHMFPQDHFTVFAIVASECEREMVLSKTSTVLTSLNRTLHTQPNLTLHIKVANAASSPQLVCTLAAASKPDLLILGLCAGSDPFPGSLASYCIVNASCRVVIKRLTYNI
ncbi:hypothetical protein HDU98_005462 [Podochytrium sp. JEL0797]|nr:hypothetical protein HDU98_005462 [Podochytrium sp. JEL0797]